jgi:hypothetical protein
MQSGKTSTFKLGHNNDKNINNSVIICIQAGLTAQIPIIKPA